MRHKKIRLLFTILLFVLFVNACGKEQKEIVGEDVVVEENNDVITEDNANETNQTETDGKDMFQTDILTVKKVGELEPLGEDYSYVFGPNVLYKKDRFINETSKFIVCSWKGDEIGKEKDVIWDNEGKYFCEYLDSEKQWYNQDGDKTLDTSMYTINEIYCDDYDYKSERYVVVSSEEKIEGVFDKTVGRFIPNLPVIEDVCDVHWVGDNIWFETENGVEIYNCEGELVKRIEEKEVSSINGLEYYINIMCNSKYQNEIVVIGKIFDENGNMLFSYLPYYYDKYELYDEDGHGKGYLQFYVSYKDYDGFDCVLVDTQGNMVDDGHKYFYNKKNSYCKLDTHYIDDEWVETRYFYDENGCYFIIETREDEQLLYEQCDLGVRYLLNTSHMMAEEPFYNIKVRYINGDIEQEIEHVDNPYVDVFFSKDGDLYSYVDGSLALDGDYNNYYYAYGRIYAENDDLSYDIFEIVEYNPPYEYKSLGTGEILGNIAVNSEEYVTDEEEVVEETEEETVVEVTVPKMSERKEGSADGFNVVNDINNGLPIYLPNDSGTGLVHDIWKSNLSTDLVIDELVGRGVVPSRFRVEGETIGFTQDIYTVVFTEELEAYIKSLSAEQEEVVMASITLTLCANRGTPAINYVDSSGAPLLTNNYYYDVPVNENTYYYLVENE